MLQLVNVTGIKLPKLYIAENTEDVKLAQENGLPYIKWNKGQDVLIKTILRPILEQMFPHIKWNQVLGKKHNYKTDVHICSGSAAAKALDPDGSYDHKEMLKAQLNHQGNVERILDWDGDDLCREAGIADSYRDFATDHSDKGYDSFEEILPLELLCQDVASSVSIEALQKLGMLPKFVGDVTDCIKTNLSNSLYWTEGYTKKLGATLGNFTSKKELPNLIILDISASIPDGIAATMIMLINTLRMQCNADLIITSRRSGYYPMGSELPEPETIFSYYGRSNEGKEFMDILNTYIAGREFGHVISFGDYDNPGRCFQWTESGTWDPKMTDTKIHEVHHYHTYNSGAKTGYALWVHDCCPDVVAHYDNSWAKVMK